MNKPTIFFSHSSRDKNMILSIKNKLEKVTDGVIDIFVSSDGQSIPFGVNWIHKVEEELKSATIMFVFVTENSISSGWIFFEAGYAYSNGIQVIPVGIGIDIATLKAPLNLLQGFNITSEECLNNFVTIINRKFEYNCNDCAFDHSDYLDVISNCKLDLLDFFNFEEVIAKTEFFINKEKLDNGQKVKYNIEKFFRDIIIYLKTNNISFSRTDNYNNDQVVCIIANGVKILYQNDTSVDKSDSEICDNYSKISFSISPYNFIKSFSLFKDLLCLFEERKISYIILHLKKGFSFVLTEEDESAILSNYSFFDVKRSYVNAYDSKELGVWFQVYDFNKYHYNQSPEYVASVVFDKENVQAENIIKLVNRLYETGFIYKK